MEQRLQVQQEEMSLINIKLETLTEDNETLAHFLSKLTNISQQSVEVLNSIAQDLERLRKNVSCRNVQDNEEGLQSPVSNVQSQLPSPPANNRPANVITQKDSQLVFNSDWMKHATLESVYQQWYGIGKFQNKPRKGGFSGLERQYKRKWRSHFKPNERTEFKHLKQAIRALENYMETKGKSLETSIAELDIEFQGEAKRSLAKFEQAMKLRGYLPTRTIKHTNTKPKEPATQVIHAK